MYLLVHIIELFCALIIFEDCPRLERSSFMDTVLPMSGINFSAPMTVVCVCVGGGGHFWVIEVGGGGGIWVFFWVFFFFFFFVSC